VTRIGVVLMLGSLPLWLLLPILPFIGISTAEKAMAATAVVVIAELMFWGGAALAGPAAVRRVKSWWRRQPTK